VNGPTTRLRQKAQQIIHQRSFPGSASDWEQRYATGGNSGAGSHGDVARFKAHELNAFVREHDIRTVLEFGSGDGRQLTLAEYPNYVGLDVSRTALQHCRRMYAHDKTKEFHLYCAPTWRRHGFRTADLTMSLDVIYHLVEDEIYHWHMEHLFEAAARYVAIFAPDREVPGTASHVRHRKFSAWIADNRPDFTLLRRVQNPHIGEESLADLYLFARKATSCHGTT
jgi:hypothetical protein